MRLGISWSHYCGSICKVMSSRSAVLNALWLNFRKNFFWRISEDGDSNRSSIYEVRAATGLSEWLLIVECRAAIRNAAGFSKAYAYMSASCRTSTRDDDPGLGHELNS